MASNAAGAASKEGAEEVGDIEVAASQAPAKDAAPVPYELYHPIREVDSKYLFQMSTWDASLFIGHRCIGVAGSVAVVFVFFATVVIQGGLCFIAIEKLSKSQYGDAVTRSLEWWRTDAHLKQYGQGRLSLVERVCNADPTLMVGTDVKQRIAMIKDYLPQFAASPITSGPAMVLLVLAIWYASLSKELHNILNFSMAMVQIPKGPRTRLINSDGGVEMATLGQARVVLAAFLAVVRLTIISVLVYAGTLRTAHTTNWGGILLNALKLNLIANVSDLLFATMMPANVKALFKKLKPLKKPRVRMWKGLDSWACIVLTFVPVGLLCAYFLVIEPELSHQLDAYNAICDGVRTFQHLDQHNVIIHMKGETYKKRDPMSNMLYAATKELIELDGTGPNGRLMSITAPSLPYFEAFAMLSESEMSAVLNRGCEDVLDVDPAMLQDMFTNFRHVEYLRKSTGNNGVSTCEDVAHHCDTGFAGGLYENSLIHARRFCSVTCKCHVPDVLLDRTYCPMGYCETRANYREVMDARQCEDRGVAELSNSSAWHGLARQMKERVRAWPPELHGQAGASGLQSIATDASRDAVNASQGLSLEDAHEFLMLRLGCDYVSLGQSLSMQLGGKLDNPCTSYAMQYHCPVTCMCHMGAPGWCPRSCTSGR